MMPRLAEGQRNRGSGMRMAGVADKDVSQAFGCTRHKLLCARYVHTATVRDRQRPRRPPDTIAKWVNFITLKHLRQRFLPATVTAIRYRLSARTIRNCLW